MEKGIFNIQLMDGPMTRDSNTKNGANGGRFNYRAKSIVKIQTRLLRETLSNQATFVAIEIAFGVKFVAVKSATPDNVGRWRTRN